MKTIRMSIAIAGMFLLVPAAMAAEPGMGWDVFYTGEGETISRSYERSPATGTEGQGFDVFHAGDGVKIDDFQGRYMGTSMGSEASDGWDVFRVGEGDPLP